MEEGAGAAREEIAVDFLKRDTRVEVGVFFLDPRFLLRRLISDAESVCDIKEFGYSYRYFCHLLIIRSRQCMDYITPTLYVSL